MDLTHATDRLRSPLRRPLTLLVALAFLNAVLNLDAAFPGRPWDSFLQLAPELLLLIIAMSLRVRRDRRFRPALYAPIAAAVIFLGLFRLVDTLVPMVLNRPFNLYLDARHLPNLLRFVWMLLSPTVFTMALAGFALALLSMAWAVVRSLKILHGGLAATGPKPLLSCLAAGVIAAGAWSGVRPEDAPAWIGPTALPRLVEEVRTILDLEGIRRRDQAAIETAIERSRSTPTNLNALNRTPVFLFVIESYG